VRGDRLIVAVALAALAGAAVAAFALQPSRGPLRGEAAADAFLGAWARSRRGTYAVESTFERELPDGRRLLAETHLVQRPPERLSVGFGTAEGTLDGHVVRCSTAPDGGYQCVEGPVARDYDAAVDDELDRLRPYVLGSPALYAVERDPSGCFRLRLALRYPSPPYGDAARFCFDEDSGAPTLTEIVRPEATDRTRATVVRPVRDADLQLPASAGSLPAPEG
jgi:hypothetical protein